MVGYDSSAVTLPCLPNRRVYSPPRAIIKKKDTINLLKEDLAYIVIRTILHQVLDVPLHIKVPGAQAASSNSPPWEITCIN